MAKRKKATVLLQYTGAADQKEFTNADFKSVEVEGQNKVVFTRDEPVQEVSTAAAEWLLSVASGEAVNFKEVTAEEVAAAGLNGPGVAFDPSEDPEEDQAALAAQADADAANPPVDAGRGESVAPDDGTSLPS